MKQYLSPIAAILCFAAAGWLVYLFFEGDSCADAGGAFRSLTAQCLTAPGETYTPVYRTGTWLFWVVYCLASLVVAVLMGGALGGIVAGLRSLWFDVLMGSLRLPLQARSRTHAPLHREP
jgi:hypothetical protein